MLKTKKGKEVLRRPMIIYNKSNPLEYHVVIGDYTQAEIDNQLSIIIEKLNKESPVESARNELKEVLDEVEGK